MHSILTYCLSNPWLLALMLVLGFVLLVKGADWLVDGASAIARRFGISDLVIGLTVVAFGTSMPEFVVNMVSVAEGSTDLAITNILGSNIINTFVILGVTALIWPVTSQKRSRQYDIPLSILACAMVYVFVRYNVPSEQEPGITRLGGIILLVLFIWFLTNTFRHAKEHPEEAENEAKPLGIGLALLFLFAGLAGLVVGGEMIVKSAVQIATNLGVSEAVIGLTVVALGTSLPELATSAMAAFKHNCDIALGNVIGSNIFNVFFVLGTSAVVRPLPAYTGIQLDAWTAVIGSLLVWIFVMSNKKRQIKRWGGAVLLLVYAAFLTYRLLPYITA
ncbi:MAG: calcium/sodium antiporter [Paludibacteraceae bacterium]|nr:calcium/sodium antiporter [Paludibacteraceae bacterium]